METTLSVTLIQHTPEPEKLVAAAAKLCYSKAGAKEIMEDLTDENVERFLSRLMDMGHASPIEHATFTFAIEGVSRSLTHQLVRHRMASFSQKSQRYVSEGQFNYVIPPEIKALPDGEKIFVEGMKNAQMTYDLLAEKLIAKVTKDLVAIGISEKKAAAAAEKQGIEDARFVLPNACETKIVVTMNARELLHFFNQRCCNRAQWEIRELATQMLIECKKVAPLLFKNGGPRCVEGPCPEGSMTCGQINEVREKFGKFNK
ncbi:FAD-dependent thymidylate synthase [Acetobacterium tundrae]|uniref:Flavin-dependent thymidylate synthase n=1 Tax=Acetobacterium tundrae TaxID=132932 RepID=A0ABR6WQ75_9FIRM|nr:FAD-dependent thymidylate synthase [Acetobacterium tundrae]MBC3798601.1 FAD-dependent thymidylate synthase [Acetobacterium tundrae]